MASNDDWGLEPLGAQARHDLLEVLDRYGPAFHHRHQSVADPRLAHRHRRGHLRRPILNRLFHNAHRLELSGESLRRSAPSGPRRQSSNRGVPRGRDARNHRKLCNSTFTRA